MLSHSICTPTTVKMGYGKAMQGSDLKYKDLVKYPLAESENSFCGTILLQYTILTSSRQTSSSGDKLDIQYRCLNDSGDT